MKKIIVIFFVLFSGINLLDAQNFNGNVRTWEQGQLTWNDFSKQSANANQHSELKYFLSYDTERQKINDTSFSRIKAKIYVDRDSSWVDPNYMNNWELRYEQIIFDILENLCQSMQPKIDCCRRTSDLDSCLQRGFNQASKEISLFQNISHYGKDTAIIIQWEQKMQQSLYYTNSRNKIPAFSPTKFGMGANLGFGSNLYIGNFSKYFNPKINVSLGFDLAIGKSELLLNATIGGSKVKTDSFFVKKECWNKNDHLELCQLSAAYGLRIINRTKWQIMPFVGYGFTEISTIAGQNDKIKHHEKAKGWIGGLCIDYKLRNSISLIPNYFKYKECCNVSLRSKIYVTQVNFSDELQGATLNFSLGISLFDQFVKLK